MPRLAYQLFFQDKTDAAVAELDKDIRRSLRATYRSVDAPPPDAFLTSKDSYLAAYDEMPGEVSLARAIFRYIFPIRHR